jgi:hypothetical protein
MARELIWVLVFTVAAACGDPASSGTDAVPAAPVTVEWLKAPLPSVLPGIAMTATWQIRTGESLGDTLLLACAGDPPVAERKPGPWLYHHDATGVSFELPPGWAVTESGAALVFSGPAGSPDYFTTVTLQAALRTDDQTLDEALAAAHAELTQLPQFAWHFREPALVATRPALRYGLQVELHESLRLKHGVLFDASGTIVNLVFAGTPEVFSTGLPIFEHVLGTVAVVDTTP